VEEVAKEGGDKGSEGGELPEYIVLLPEPDGDAGTPDEVSEPLEA
jgi:hypothetical protein